MDDNDERQKEKNTVMKKAKRDFYISFLYICLPLDLMNIIWGIHSGWDGEMNESLFINSPHSYFNYYSFTIDVCVKETIRSLYIRKKLNKKIIILFILFYNIVYFLQSMFMLSWINKQGCVVITFSTVKFGMPGLSASISDVLPVIS